MVVLLVKSILLHLYFAPPTLYTGQKPPTIHQLTTMLPTSKNVLCPGRNHLLTTGTDDPSHAGARATIKVLGHQHRWLAGGYDMVIEHF